MMVLLNATTSRVWPKTYMYWTCYLTSTLYRSTFLAILPASFSFFLLRSLHQGATESRCCNDCIASQARAPLLHMLASHFIADVDPHWRLHRGPGCCHCHGFPRLQLRYYQHHERSMLGCSIRQHRHGPQYADRNYSAYLNHEPCCMEWRHRLRC